MFLIEMLDGLFSVGHIVFMILCFGGTLAGGILIKLHVKNEKTVEIILRVSGFLALASVITMRISETVYHCENHLENYKWYFVLPETFCSFSTFTLGCAVAFGKKNNAVLHFAFYMALYGGFLSTIYPDYLEYEPFFSVRGMTSLLHHGFDVWICFLIAIEKYITPEPKKIFNFIVGFLCMMLLGVFEVFVLKYNDAMNILNPLLSDLPYLTTWYSLFIAATLVTLGFIFMLSAIYGRKIKFLKKTD